MTMAAPSAAPSLRDWLAGARPRTLPTSVIPVLVGSGVAAAYDSFRPIPALLAVIVALSLQIGVNYANDYSDGIRGTDTDRVGPARLVASGVARPNLVKLAAFAAFGVAMVAGLVVVVITAQWWLLVVGLAAVIAAWTYTGGPRPYGYRALGELGVFVFFGLVAVCGTTFVQLERIPWLAVGAAAPIGALACALLIVNNLRDIPGDTRANKRTLAVVLGDETTRALYASVIAGSFVLIAGVAVWRPWAGLALLAAPAAIAPLRRVMGGARGPRLIAALQETARLQIAVGVLLTLGLVLL